MSQSILKQSKGFTLLETLLVIIILGIVASVGAVMIEHAVKAYQAQADLKEMDEDAYLTFNRLTRELQNCTHLASSFGPGSENTLTFYIYHASPVTYFFDPSAMTLTRNDRLLSKNLSRMSVTCHDLEGANVACSDSYFLDETIKYYQLVLTWSKNNKSITLQDVVFLRN